MEYAPLRVFIGGALIVAVTYVAIIDAMLHQLAGRQSSGKLSQVPPSV